MNFQISILLLFLTTSCGLNLNKETSDPLTDLSTFVPAPEIPAIPTPTTSITRHGITWTFSGTVQAGSFANGDPWVIGPVSVIGISPPSQIISGRTVNGSMLNPKVIDVNGARHGYDSTLFGQFGFRPDGVARFDPTLNVAIGVSPSNPLNIPANSSLISTISATAPSTASVSQLETASVLTTLSTIPAFDAFRPNYTGNDKTLLFRESDIDYSRLRNIPPAPGSPDLAVTANRFERVWLDHMSGWPSRYLHPRHMPDYARDFSSLFGTGVLLANTNLTLAQKKTLVVRLVQIGIDFMGNVQNGGFWESVGGQGSGRKFPIMFAAELLKSDPDSLAMRNIGTTHRSYINAPDNFVVNFGEDASTFFVQQTSPNIFNFNFGGYNASHVGMPEWGNGHTHAPQNDNVNWFFDDYRRCCTANAWVGQTLAARLMNLVSDWNHPAYFAYMDRYMTETAPGGMYYSPGEDWTRSWDDWQLQMWNQYRSQFSVEQPY
jgi:hypothetical protein